MNDDSDVTLGQVIKSVLFVFVIMFSLYGCGVVFGVVTLPFQAVQSGTTVVRRIIDPDTMLMQYRWFKDANARLQAFPAQIKLAKKNLEYAEKHTPDYVANRMTEFTGIQQVCMSLVADYNSRAQRIDSGFLRNPERWLPVGNYEPLPDSYPTSYCNGDEPQ